MKRLLLLLSGAGAFACAQISDLATTADGRTLLFRSTFRLRTETDLKSEAKIYQWQDGQWTRLADAGPQTILPSGNDVSQPFLSSDGLVYGWHALTGCGLCQLFGPMPYSVVNGVTLPKDSPTAYLRMSPNARFFVGGSSPIPQSRYLDLQSGQAIDVPDGWSSYPLVREIANDGTLLILQVDPNDPAQSKAIGTLVLWNPGSNPRPVYHDLRAFGVAPGPANPFARPLTPFACYAFAPQAIGLYIPFLAYTPFLVGFYQVDATLPDPLPSTTMFLECTPDNVTFGSAYVYTPQ